MELLKNFYELLPFLGLTRHAPNFRKTMKHILLLPLLLCLSILSGCVLNPDGTINFSGLSKHEKKQIIPSGPITPKELAAVTNPRADKDPSYPWKAVKAQLPKLPKGQLRIKGVLNVDEEYRTEFTDEGYGRPFRYGLVWGPNSQFGYTDASCSVDGELNAPGWFYVDVEPATGKVKKAKAYGWGMPRCKVIEYIAEQADITTDSDKTVIRFSGDFDYSNGQDDLVITILGDALKAQNDQAFRLTFKAISVGGSEFSPYSKGETIGLGTGIAVVSRK